MSMNAFIAGVVGGALTVIAAKVLALIAAKLKLLPEWLEGRTGWHVPDALHAAFDTAVDAGVAAAQAYTNKNFWASVVNSFRKGRTEEGLQAFLEVLKTAIKAGATSVQIPPEWKTIWDEIRTDIATDVAKADLAPHVALNPDAKLPDDKALVGAIKASVVVDKATNAPAPINDAGAVHRTIDELIAESKARQAKLTAPK